MNKLIFWALITCAAQAACQEYRITGNRQVISDCYGYAFQVPKKWYISASNPTPYMFNFKPGLLPTVGAGVPANRADISVIADEASHNLGSIEKWMEVDRKADGFSSVQELKPPPNAAMTRAFEAVSVINDGGTRKKVNTKLTAIYFDFENRPFAAYLRYNLQDPKGEEYHSTLTAILASFQRLPANPEKTANCRVTHP